MLDGPFDLGRYVAFGHPRHGVWRGTKLRRLDAVDEAYPVTAGPGSGDVLVFKRSDLPAIPTSLSDTAGPGQEFRRYALISGALSHTHTKALCTAGQVAWVYLDEDGTRWWVRITTPLTSTSLPVSTAFNLSITFTKFGEFGGEPETITRTQSVSADVFGEDQSCAIGWTSGLDQIMYQEISSYRMRLEDVSRTGGRAAVAWTYTAPALLFSLASIAAEDVQSQPVALAEITISINPSDELPDFSISNHSPRSAIVPPHTYSGPSVDGCPFGLGTKTYAFNRAIGAFYADSGSLELARARFDTEQVYSASTQAVSSPCGEPAHYTDGGSATSTATMQIEIGSASLSIPASSSWSATCDADVDSYGRLSNQAGVTNGSVSLGGVTLLNSTGAGGGSCQYLSSDPCGDPLLNLKVHNHTCSLGQGAYAAESVMPVACSPYFHTGEYPMGLTLSPISVAGDDGHPGADLARILIRRLSNKLWALLWRRGSDLNLYGLIGPAGPIHAFTMVVATGGTPDYEFQAGAYGSLGEISPASLTGTFNPETGECVVSTDGVQVCFV